MANVRHIKQRIGTAKNISKITKAMEMVSASKMRRAQEQTLAARPYAEALIAAMIQLNQEAPQHLHPLLSRHDVGVPILIIISTDRGLCGSLNQNLFKQVTAWHRLHPQGQYIIVGKKAVSFAQFVGLPIYAQFTNLPDKISLKDVLPISTLIMEHFSNQDFASVDIVFTDFINTLSQKTNRQRILPIQEPRDSEMTLSPEAHKEYVFEPNAKDLLSELLPYYVENAVYQAFLEAKASEHSARMVAMKNASENAKDLVTELLLVYNKSRQESITSEILDISTASMTLEQ
ncbi:MAG: ATP synthase F1 subunit gamma [Patescibacteria group bacterium]